MSKPGFYIRKLLLTSSHAPTASISFKRGFNVITGASDTGKSYILQCLNFLFGSKDRPKPIPEARPEPYENAVLEIETYGDGQIYSIKRAFESGHIKKYEKRWSDVDENTEYERLTQKHGHEKENSLSYFYLNLSELKEKWLKKNKNGGKKSLSFRDVIDFSLIDEQRVITEQSPIHSGRPFTKTPEEDLFKTLITGTDSSHLNEREDQKSEKRKAKSQIELLDKLIDEHESNHKLEDKSQSKISDRIKTVEDRLNFSKKKTDDIGSKIDRVYGQIEKIDKRLRKKKSRLLVVRELLERFKLLKEQYNSDVRRLKFISEADHYFNQLHKVRCPTCGQPFRKGKHVDCAEENVETKIKNVDEELRKACHQEIRNIRKHENDLEESVDNLSVEEKDLTDKILSLKSNLSTLEEKLESDLKPLYFKVNKIIQWYSKERSRLSETRQAFEHYQDLKSTRADLQRALEKSDQVEELESRSEPIPYQRFAQTVQSILRRWGYPSLEGVEFDEEQMDLVISGEPRSGHGKGIRAILFSSFIVGLLRFCRNRNLPHPGFIILDSPLTPFRAPEEEDDEVGIGQNLQESFFSSMVDVEKDRQVILLENKEPTDKIKNKISYVKFTKSIDVGRYGFIPIQEISK